MQLKPSRFSKYQHLKYKPPRSLKATVTEESIGVVLTTIDGPDKGGASKAAETENDLTELAAGQKNWDTAGNSDKAESKDTETKGADQKQEEVLPRPSTFAQQTEMSVIHRLVNAGHPSYMLTENWRQHGMNGVIFQQAVLP